MSPLQRTSGPIAFLLIWLSAPALADREAACVTANPDFPDLCACVVAGTAEEGFADDVLDRLISHNYIGVPPEDVKRFGKIFVACTQAAVARQMANGMALANAHSGSANGTQAAASSSTSYTLKTPGGRPVPGRWIRNAAIERPHHGGEWTVTPARGGFVRDDSGHFLIAGCNDRALPQLVFGPVEEHDNWTRVEVDVQAPDEMLMTQAATPSRIEGNLLQAEFANGIIDALRRGSTVRLTATGTDDTSPLTTTFGLDGSFAALEFADCDGPVAARATGFPGILVNGEWRGTHITDADDRSVPALTFGPPDSAMESLTFTCDRHLGIAPLPRYPGPDRDTPVTYGYALTVDNNAGYQTAVTLPGASTTEGRTAEPLHPGLVDQMAAGKVLHVAPLDMAPGDGLLRSYELRGFGDGLAALACEEKTSPPD